MTRSDTKSWFCQEIADVFPSGRRRGMLLELAQHPEFDGAEWTGRVIFRCYRTDKAGRAGLAIKIEPDEETVQ